MVDIILFVLNLKILTKTNQIRQDRSGKDTT